MPILRAKDVAAVLRKGGSARREDGAPARFKADDRIVVRNLNPTGHTRAPRYVRCKRGVIDRDHGVFVWPDSNAHGRDETPQHVYSVRFEARDVWGPDAAANQTIYVDLWDDYLDPA
jgi:hypothetical protein